MRSWGFKDVEKWLLEYGASSQAVAAARSAGVVDGPAFLKLTNSMTLEQWGVHSRIKLLRMEAALQKLREEDQGTLFQRLISIVWFYSFSFLFSLDPPPLLLWNILVIFFSILNIYSYVQSSPYKCI